MVRKIKFNINLSNRVLYTLIATGIIILLGIVVYAYGGTQPSIMGHTWGEIGGIPAGFADGIDNVGISTESDPTVNAYVKNKGSCAAITGGTGLCDGVDDAGPVYYNMNLGEDYYPYWNTDGGGLTRTNPHSDNCNGDNTKPYVCLPNEERTCLDSANTGDGGTASSYAHHRRIICKKALVAANPGTYTMSQAAATEWIRITDLYIAAVNNGACSANNNCPSLTSILGGQWVTSLSGTVSFVSNTWDQ